MKKLIILLLTVPGFSFAASLLPLPLPEKNTDSCYIRVYSKEHLAKHPSQKIKGAAVTLTNYEGSISVKTEVRLLDGKSMFNYGSLLNSDQPAPRLMGIIDDDGGSFYLSQNQTKADEIQLKVRNYLYLEEDNYTTNDNIPEGTPFESIVIQNKTEDSIWNLERIRVNGSIMKTCSQVLEDLI
jgi:hypothetical protein